MNLDGEQYLYIENSNQQNIASKVIGVFLHVNNTEQILQQWSTDNTKHIQGILLPEQNKRKCFIFIYEEKKHPNIFCELETNEWLSIYQELKTFTKFQIHTITVGPNIYLIIIHDEIEDNEAYIDIWKLDENTELFNRHQIIYATAPNSISAVSFKNNNFMAISSGHLHNALYQGSVQIYRLDRDTGHFIYSQDIQLSAPIQVEFAVLPSEELVLYILTDNITKPLYTYIYEGISGFKLKHVARSLSKITNIIQFNTIDGNHFVLGRNNKEATLLQAYFKGYKQA